MLSEPLPACRIGSVLPDLVRRSELQSLPGDFQRGIRQHYEVDAFTDAHPVFRRSVARLPSPYRRFGGIIMDVFYDHLLSNCWHQFAREPLRAMVVDFYGAVDRERECLPGEAVFHLDRIRSEDLLCSYGEIDGVRDALRRLGRRMKRPVPLEESLEALNESYDAVRSDFLEFFPELQAEAKSGLARSRCPQ